MPTTEKQRPRVTSRASPSFSQNSRSPSLDPPAYTTDDLLFAKYQRISKGVHWTRVSLSTLILVASVAIIGCTANTLQEYSRSKSRPEWVLPLWPIKIDLRPTRTLLSCGVMTAAFSLTYLILALIPLRRKLHSLNIASTITAFLGLALSVFAIIFASVVTNSFSSDGPNGSLISWTCKWQGFENLTPTNFAKICNEGSAALDLTLLIVILEVFYVSASAGGWWVETMLRRSESDDPKSRVALV